MFESWFPSNWSTLKKLIWLYALQHGGGGSSSVTLTVTGISPLVLANAIAHSILSLTQYGKCELRGEGTQGPENPYTIWCNNGRLVARHASGLPTGHTLVETVYNAASTSAATNIKDDVDDVEYEIRVKPNNGSWYIFQSRAAANAYIYGVSGSSSGQTITFVYGLPTGLTSGIGARNPDHIYLVRASHKNGVATLYVKDETTGEEDTQTATYDTADYVPSTVNLRFWGNSQNTVNAGNYIYHAKLWKQGQLVLDAVPDKYGGAAGLYDFVSGAFIGATAGTLYAGDPVDDPVGVYADGDDEVLTVCGKNLLDAAHPYKTGYSINASGVETETSSHAIYIIPAKAGETYTYSCTYSTGSSTTRIHTYDADGNWIKQETASAQNATKTFTAPANTAEIRVSMAVSAADTAQVEHGSNATDFSAYTAQTASVVNLFGLGDIADTQEIIAGLVNRKIGIKVFDGTENFTYTTADFIYRNSTLRTPAGTPLFCTHFQNATAGSVANMPDLSCRTHPSTDGPVYFRMNSCTTADAFKAVLAAEYAAGHPVILVYVLDEAVTEQVAPQPLRAYEGTTVIDVSAAIAGIVLACAYKGVAAEPEVEPDDEDDEQQYSGLLEDE